MKNGLKSVESQDYIEISDLALVSALQCLGFSFIRTKGDPDEYPKIRFIFSKTNKLERIITNFWDGTLLVEPKNYWRTVREIKSRIQRNK